MRFTGIVRPEEFRTVTRAHIVAWRDGLGAARAWRQHHSPPTLTPGAARTTDTSEICAHGTRELRHWSRERDDRIMMEYGLRPGPHPDYEVDHLIPLGIGRV